MQACKHACIYIGSAPHMRRQTTPCCPILSRRGSATRTRGPAGGTSMLDATLHDGSTIAIQVHGAGDGARPTLLLPVNPQPVTGAQADSMRAWGADPALGS